MDIADPADRRQTGKDRRSLGGERRHQPRGGRRAGDHVVAAVLALGAFVALPASAAPDPSGKRTVGTVKTGRRATDVLDVVATRGQSPGPGTVAVLPPMRFGVDASSLPRAAKAGLEVSYAAVWVGPWTEKHGWEGVREDLREARRRGATPVVHWWYWGDDISPAAVENGVTDRYHGLRKDRAGWTRMSSKLATLLAKEGGAEALVVLETEFNKPSMDGYEAFDGYLVEQMDVLRRAGNVKVVLGFGNWARQKWQVFDRAVKAADLVGLQCLQSSVREPGNYPQAVDALVTGSRHVQKQFGKPVLVMDFALSSYGPDYERVQARVVEELFARLPELKLAGVTGFIYRSIVDDPGFDTANYHGPAERHWGLLRKDGSPKPAFAAFLRGVRDERANGRLALVRPPTRTADRGGD